MKKFEESEPGHPRIEEFLHEQSEEEKKKAKKATDLAYILKYGDFNERRKAAEEFSNVISTIQDDKTREAVVQGFFRHIFRITAGKDLDKQKEIQFMGVTLVYPLIKSFEDDKIKRIYTGWFEKELEDQDLKEVVIIGLGEIVKTFRKDEDKLSFIERLLPMLREKEEQIRYNTIDALFRIVETLKDEDLKQKYTEILEEKADKEMLESIKSKEEKE